MLNSLVNLMKWIKINELVEQIGLFRSCLYEKNHPTQVRRFTWVRSRQNGAIHFVKQIVYMRMDSSHPAEISRQRRWNLTYVGWCFPM